MKSKKVIKNKKGYTKSRPRAKPSKKLTLNTLEKRISSLMSKEDRKDAEFRLAIVLSEIGDIAKYITHDPELNPNARPHGSRNDEILAYGQLLCQIVALQYLRGINIKDSLDRGLSNWEDADWRKREVVKTEKPGTISGISVVPGKASGNAYVVSPENPIESFDGGILVVSYANPSIANYIPLASAVITDHGGKTCHAAQIAIEYNIPCVVGTGNASHLIKHNEKVEVKSSHSSDGIVILVERLKNGK